MRFTIPLAIALGVGQAVAFVVAVPRHNDIAAFSSLEKRADPYPVAETICTTDDKETFYGEESVEAGVTKFKHYINMNPDTFPKGPGKKPRTYPSRNVLKKAPDVADALNSIPSCKTKDSSTRQWWEYPLIDSTSGYTGGSPGTARLIFAVTDNGSDKSPRYTDIQYCIPVSYVKDDKAALHKCRIAETET